ncbi:Ataxin-3 [Podila humilis]|nr:Ataxin-3 [Podila humilis]
MDLVPYIFHEQQEGNLCAQHCLNALLQGPYFTAIDLAELARQLDQQEDEALGRTSESSTRNNNNNKSQNMDDSGFFSVQVLSHALSIWNAQIIPWGAKEVRAAKMQPEREFAFICNLDQHWYTLRRFGPSTHRWYDLNSMLRHPQYMSATYLGMTLSQLEAEGYSIFVVRPLSDNGTDQQPTSSNTEISKVLTSSSSPAAPKLVEPATEVPVTSPATSGFLSERQEMERIRRKRLEEREKAQQQSSTSKSSEDSENIDNKRTRIDRDGEELTSQKMSKNNSGDSPLVVTPTFLPRCEADTMAATLPMDNVQQSSNSSGMQEQPFGGTGHRLGGQESVSSAAAAAAALDSSFGDYGDFGEAEQLEDEMMQQAIAMSLKK